LIEEEIARFRRRMQSLDAVPTILALQERMEQIRQDEIQRIRTKLGPLSAEQQSAIENLTRSIVNKILHPPISALKAAGGSDELTATAELLRSVFGLEAASHENGFRPDATSSHAQESKPPKAKSPSDPPEPDSSILKFTARS
jgi:hypothetical protein